MRRDCLASPLSCHWCGSACSASPGVCDCDSGTPSGVCEVHTRTVATDTNTTFAVTGAWVLAPGATLAGAGEGFTTTITADGDVTLHGRIELVPGSSVSFVSTGGRVIVGPTASLVLRGALPSTTSSTLIGGVLRLQGQAGIEIQAGATVQAPTVQLVTSGGPIDVHASIRVFVEESGYLGEAPGMSGYAAGTIPDKKGFGPITFFGGSGGVGVGAAHGGLGGALGSYFDTSYGSLVNPSSYGSRGGTNIALSQPAERFGRAGGVLLVDTTHDNAAPGGADVTLVTSAVSLDASGTSPAWDAASRRSGGGSGGSIQVHLGTSGSLLGLGSVRARGGDAPGTGGGGGRVAIVAQTEAQSAVFLERPGAVALSGGTTLNGGACSGLSHLIQVEICHNSAYRPGGAGTLYLSASQTLHVPGPSSTAYVLDGLTPLSTDGMYNDPSGRVVAGLKVYNNGRAAFITPPTSVAPHASVVLENTDVTLTGGGQVLAVSYNYSAFDPATTGSIVFDSGSQLRAYSDSGLVGWPALSVEFEAGAHVELFGSAFMISQTLVHVGGPSPATTTASGGSHAGIAIAGRNTNKVYGSPFARNTIGSHGHVPSNRLPFLFGRGGGITSVTCPLLHVSNDPDAPPAPGGTSIQARISAQGGGPDCRGSAAVSGASAGSLNFNVESVVRDSDLTAPLLVTVVGGDGKNDCSGNGLAPGSGGYLGVLTSGRSAAEHQASGSVQFEFTGGVHEGTESGPSGTLYDVASNGLSYAAPLAAPMDPAYAAVLPTVDAMESAGVESLVLGAGVLALTPKPEWVIPSTTSLSIVIDKGAQFVCDAPYPKECVFEVPGDFEISGAISVSAALHLVVNGVLTLDSGTISATTPIGDFTNGTATRGASHAGQGWFNGKTYGDPVWPRAPGSNSIPRPPTYLDGAGGGALFIQAQDMVMRGSSLLSVNGKPGVCRSYWCGVSCRDLSGGGSGGSLLIQLGGSAANGTLTGTGTLSADGGPITQGTCGQTAYGGGGGRVAIHASHIDPTIVVRALGGSGSAPGTVYFSHNKTMVIGSGQTQSVLDTVFTPMPRLDSGADPRVATVIVTGTAAVSQANTPNWYPPVTLDPETTPQREVVISHVQVYVDSGARFHCVGQYGMRCKIYVDAEAHNSSFPDLDHHHHHSGAGGGGGVGWIHLAPFASLVGTPELYLEYSPNAPTLVLDRSVIYARQHQVWHGPGAGTPASTRVGGGSHGGEGEANGVTYGSPKDPRSVGSGNPNIGRVVGYGAGGGVVFIRHSAIHLESPVDGSAMAKIHADGAIGKCSRYHAGVVVERSQGGGSGGSLQLHLRSLTGKGIISASGGNVDGGGCRTPQNGRGGGGGRMVFNVTDYSEGPYVLESVPPSLELRVWGGLYGGGGGRSGAGTLYLPANDTVVIANQWNKASNLEAVVNPLNEWGVSHVYVNTSTLVELRPYNFTSTTGTLTLGHDSTTRCTRSYTLGGCTATFRLPGTLAMQPGAFLIGLPALTLNVEGRLVVDDAVIQTRVPGGTATATDTVARGAAVGGSHGGLGGVPGVPRGSAVNPRELGAHGGVATPKTGPTPLGGGYLEVNADVIEFTGKEGKGSLNADGNPAPTFAYKCGEHTCHNNRGGGSGGTLRVTVGEVVVSTFGGSMTAAGGDVPRSEGKGTLPQAAGGGGRVLFNLTGDAQPPPLSSGFVIHARGGRMPANLARSGGAGSVYYAHNQTLEYTGDARGGIAFPATYNSTVGPEALSPEERALVGTLLISQHDLVWDVPSVPSGLGERRRRRGAKSTCKHRRTTYRRTVRRTVTCLRCCVVALLSCCIV